jgi:hypothetical protein
MSPAALKLELHDLIDRVEDEEQLLRLLVAVKQTFEQGDAELWNMLTQDQIAEAEEALEESKDRATRISHEEMIRRYFS